MSVTNEEIAARACSESHRSGTIFSASPYECALKAAEIARAEISAALSEQTLPVAWLGRDNLYRDRLFGDRQIAQYWLEERDGVERELVPLYAHPVVSSLVDNSHASEEVVTDEMIEAGARAMHAHGDEGKWSACGMKDFYRKYAEEVLRAALSSLRPAEVGSATDKKGQADE